MEKTNYYAIIPGNVRYDKNLKANCKLLYGEITALCNEKGYCWASNDYFAKLYLVTPQAISKWVKQLSDFGYISLEYVREGKEIKQRKIRLEVSTNIDRVSTNVSEGYQQKIKDNNTYINNTNNKDIKDIKGLQEDPIDFDALLVFFNNTTGRKLRTINDKAKKGFNNIIKQGYTKKDIRDSIVNCFNSEYHQQNRQYLTPEFISRMEKFEKYFDSKPKKLKLPQGYFNMKLNDEQMKLLPEDELRRYKTNMIKLEMDGGFIKQAPIEYED
jgi:hypothetical protein